MTKSLRFALFSLLKTTWGSNSSYDYMGEYIHNKLLNW